MIFITVRLNKERLDVVESEELSKKLILKKIFSNKIHLDSFSAEKIDELAQVISSAVSINPKVTKISFCVDTSFAFLNVIPIDGSLTEQEFSEHLLWEISQYFPEESDHQSFIVRGYKFSGNGTQKTLIVAVRKDLISFLKGVAEKLGLTVQIIDIDHFAVENCLRERISSVRSRYFYSDFLLVGLKSSRIDISIFRSYEFQRYFYRIVNDESDKRYFLVKLINDYTSAGFEKFVFYGEELDQGLIGILSGMLGNKFSILNPFDSRLFLDIRVELESAHIFAPNIGLALRMLWSG
jgi:Tfp pilus assembly PilM family ATPase